MIDLYDICEGYKVVETVEGGHNGYPTAIKKAITGFESYPAAEKFAEKYGLRIIHLHKRDGWQMWERGDSAYGPYIIKASDYGDNYNEIASKEQMMKDMYSVLGDMIAGEEPFHIIRDYIKDMEELYAEVLLADNDEKVITCNGRYYETIPAESMEWSFDTHHYTFGLVE